MQLSGIITVNAQDLIKLCELTVLVSTATRLPQPAWLSECISLISDLLSSLLDGDNFNLNGDLITAQWPLEKAHKMLSS